jgi:hypothetical protein
MRSSESDIRRDDRDAEIDIRSILLLQRAGAGICKKRIEKKDRSHSRGPSEAAISVFKRNVRRP